MLDRLIDSEPARQAEAPLTRAQSLRRLKAAVKRDLEWLLNTRRTIQEAPSGATELERSVYHYGLPDFTGFSLRSTRDQQKIVKMLESTIAQFEPRLANVRVTMEPVSENARLLRFVIEGLLRVDPAPERVSFDTVLELSSGRYLVMGEPGAG
ncbi:MAG: type VI secretion system baseplate subunit TssE [Bryobacterales bacterium]|nr:type VI secretion system baseplate subunit TssE [Bryobacteraceae bacterium]MDW8129665.1 type VI secretion system baseplate subunit TssE [Bryobacterales bacterium]